MPIKILGKCLDEKGHYSKHYTFSAAVVMDGIVYLAANDSNKVKLVKVRPFYFIVNSTLLLFADETGFCLEPCNLVMSLNKTTFTTKEPIMFVLKA